MRIDRNKCVGCGNCVPVCPMEAICLGTDGYAEIDTEACVECHTCYRGLSVENLPPWPVRYVRRLLAAIHLRFQPEPDICPTGALDSDPLSWPRIVRRAFSDPQVPHESTAMAGRGTAEAKTNDVTNRIETGEAGFVVELGRPGVGVYFREVDRVSRALAQAGMVFEKENPVTYLMHDPVNGCIRKDVLGEKVLSCIIESKTRIEKVPEILGVINGLAPDLETVISLGISSRCDENGDDPLLEILQKMGYGAWRAKINLGLGRVGEPIVARQKGMA